MSHAAQHTLVTDVVSQRALHFIAATNTCRESSATADVWHFMRPLRWQVALSNGGDTTLCYRLHALAQSILTPVINSRDIFVTFIYSGYTFYNFVELLFMLKPRFLSAFIQEC